ncbi:MAG: sugar porter family MFS transporter [Phycisphaerae bacterium]
MTQDNSTLVESQCVRLGYVVPIAIVAALGGLLFGYDWVVISGAKPFFVPHFHLINANIIGWAMSCALLGALAGALMTGWLTDKFGRKKLLAVAAILFAVSSILTGWAPAFMWFALWRIIGGVAIGMASNLSPLYIAEISPAHFRGRLVALNQLTIVIGILLADVVNWLIAQPIAAHATTAMIAASWDGRLGWRWMFTVVAVPSIVFLLGTLVIPESPRWLAKQGRIGEAREILARIAGDADADGEIIAIQETLRGEQAGRVKLSELLTPGMLNIISIGVLLAVFQQWCGINVIFSYAQDIFHAAGYRVNGVLFDIMITGAVNLIFTLVAMGLVDRIGRRPLMLIGAGGLVITHTLLGFAYYENIKGLPVVILVMAAIACYAMTLAPITWVLISEIFPNRIRGTAISIAVSALWIADFLLTQTFPSLKAAVGNAGAFWLYALICVAGFIFVFTAISETKGKSLEQVEEEFHVPVAPSG